MILSLGNKLKLVLKKIWKAEVLFGHKTTKLLIRINNILVFIKLSVSADFDKVIFLNYIDGVARVINDARVFEFF